MAGLAAVVATVHCLLQRVLSVLLLLGHDRAPLVDLCWTTGRDTRRTGVTGMV